MIQDIQPKVYDNAFRQKAPDKTSLILFIKDNAVLAKETEDGIAFPRYGELEPRGTSYTYLFSIDRTTFFLAPAVDPQENYGYHPMMEFRNKRPKHLAFAAATACQLYDWYSKNRFCGRCGAEMVHDQKERMMRCENCGNMVYPGYRPRSSWV